MAEKTVRYNYTGICPKTGKERTIQLLAQEVFITGQYEPEYKNLGLECPEQSACSYNSYEDDTICPLFLRATP